MEINDKIRTSSWAKLKYYDPVQILGELRNIEQQIAGAQMDEKVRALRTQLLKKHKEGREAALLCHGIGTCVLDTTVWFSPTEDFDYDFVSMWRTEKIEHYAPVQFKEWVPDHINPYVTLNALVLSLEKYKSSKDMILGIYSNRAGTFRLSEIIIPKVNLAGLWVFGSITPDQSKWFLFGNVINAPQYYEFMYPPNNRLKLTAAQRNACGPAAEAHVSQTNGMK